MFTAADLSKCLTETWFQAGYEQLERNLLSHRLGQPSTPLAQKTRVALKRFSQAVIASAATWNNPRDPIARQLCQVAGDIEAAFIGDGLDAHASHVKAILLYELGGLPGASASYAKQNGFDPRFRDFFSRTPESLWGRVASSAEDLERHQIKIETPSNPTLPNLVDQALGEVIARTGVELQSESSHMSYGRISALAAVASDYNLGLTGDDISAVSKLLDLRLVSSSLSLLPQLSNLSRQDLKTLAPPVELWPAQVEALKGGLLDKNITSFGLASPTGTGKTSLTQVLIAETLHSNPDGKVLYICPSRALVHQVSRDLQEGLKAFGSKVLEAGAHLVTHEAMPLSAADADVLVFTPERADLLLRIDLDFLQDVSLIIVDEAHHIEQQIRGVLLEFYLWRLRKMVPAKARIVQLSAVAPNIADLTNWLAPPGKAKPVVMDWRSTRLRLGILERSSGGNGQISFANSEPYNILPGQLPTGHREGLAVLANELSSSGIVLVLCTSVSAAQEIAGLVAALREKAPDPVDSNDAVGEEVAERVDAWIERELYSECPLRGYLKKGVVYHHAQLPPRVRSGIEESIRKRRATVICATTTLAEGINFPFSTVIVESLVAKTFELSPRDLWNIAGRAGRFGVDTEGHCIIYRPSTWEKRLKRYEIKDYVKTAMLDIPPVTSALATGIKNLQNLISAGSLSDADLESINLSDIKVDGRATNEAKSVRALINIMRVGYAHANSTGAIDLADGLAPEFAGELLASKQLNDDGRKFAHKLAIQQRAVVRRATDENPKFVQIAAKVGWSLEAQLKLYIWIKSCADWQLTKFGNIVVGGNVTNLDQLGYLLGPLSKHLIAFEGEALGGATAFHAAKWIQGIPLSAFQAERGDSFGKLISKIYGRMQYLLPWGLFGLHELLMYEAELRNISVGDGVSSLAVLASEGAPNFDAFSLVTSFGVERADATRLSLRYRRHRQTAVIEDWFATRAWNEIAAIVRGSDQRRIDPNLRTLHEELNT